MKGHSMGKSMRAVREEYNFRQREIAAAIGLDRSTYSFYETGKTFPSIETLCKIANIYNVSLGYLIGREPNNPELMKRDYAVSSNVDPIALLNEEERMLIMHYRVASDDDKKELVQSFIEKNKKSRAKKNRTK